MESILTSVKKALGIEDDYTQFDSDIIMHINTTIMGLTQIGVGPSTGFAITSKTDTWVDFIGDSKAIEGVKTFIYLKVRMIFDPPSSSYVLESMDRCAKELEWRLSVQVDVPLVTPPEEEV